MPAGGLLQFRKQKETMNMNVIEYLRVSGKGQVDGDGPERQHDKIKDFCTAHGLHIVESAYEKAVSGTVEAMDRPIFSLVMERITRGDLAIGAIVVERMDRLARDLMVQEFLLKECRARGIKVFSADFGTTDDMASNDVDPTRVLIRQVLGALAQWEKAQIVAKLAAARNRIKASGQRCEGNRPYGSKPGEAAVMNVMLELYATGMGFASIAGMLNSGGFTTRSGSVWTGPKVYDIIRNRKFGHSPEPEDSESFVGEQPGDSTSE
jgi:DNA invertase Pin-like site-specific DNA recombinase